MLTPKTANTTENICKLKRTNVSTNVRTEMDKLLTKLELSESTYIEMLVRADLKKRKIITEAPKIYNLEDWWDEQDDPKIKVKIGT